MEGRGSVIINGSINGDRNGEMTYIASMRGNTVIDYAICDGDTWKDIEGMKIGLRAKSDHRLLEVSEAETELAGAEGTIRVENWTVKRC